MPTIRTGPLKLPTRRGVSKCVGPEAPMRHHPTPLDVIEVKEPCHASWESMRGDGRVRFCQGCGKLVHNLSAMSREEAAALVGGCAAAGELCVRFARSPDGGVATLEYRPAPPS